MFGSIQPCIGSIQPCIGSIQPRRGREGQRNLTPSSFTFAVDENARAYATMTHNKLFKNHPDGFDDTESFEKDGRMYRATDDLSDGYNALELYISKLKPTMSSILPVPEAKVVPKRQCLVRKSATRCK